EFVNDVDEICRRDDALLDRLNSLAGECRHRRCNQASRNVRFFNQNRRRGPIGRRPKRSDTDGQRQDRATDSKSTPLFAAEKSEVLAELDDLDTCDIGHWTPGCKGLAVGSRGLIIVRPARRQLGSDPWAPLSRKGGSALPLLGHVPVEDVVGAVTARSVVLMR